MLAPPRAITAAPNSPPPGIRGALVVTNCDDSGPGSLREAYFNAIDQDVIDLWSFRAARSR